MTEPIRFFLDGAEVEAAPGETIWQVADRRGIEIPHLCWLPKPGYRADGNCRACMVEIEGERVLAASCVRQPMPGMKVQTASERARFSRKMVFELLIGDPAKARERLGWRPKVSFGDLVRMMVDADLQRLAAAAR